MHYVVHLLKIGFVLNDMEETVRKYRIGIVSVCVCLCIAVLVVASSICDARLFNAYMDYGSEIFLACPHCGSLGVWHYDLSSHSRHKVPIKQKLSMKYATLFRGKISNEVVFNSATKCQHSWDSYVPLQSKSCYSVSSFLPLPEKYFLDCKKIGIAFLALCFFVLLLCVLVFFYKSLFSRRLGVLVFFCSIICCVCSFAYLLVIPMGTSLTAMTNQMRKLRHKVACVDITDEDWRNISFLLSEDAIKSCENFKDEGEKYRQFKNFLLKEQARLAASIAPCNLDLSERFFYGQAVHDEKDFTWRIRRLGETQRIKSITDSYDVLDVHTISTNSTGAVQVIWESMNSRILGLYGETCFVSVQSAVGNENNMHWIPVRNIDETPMTYYSRMFLRCSW